MGFICSAGAATIKLQCEMKRGNISARAGASLFSRGSTRRRFLLHPGRAGPRCCGAPAAPQSCASGHGSSVFHAQGWFWCSAAVAGTSGIVAQFPLTSARLEEQEHEAVI